MHQASGNYKPKKPRNCQDYVKAKCGEGYAREKKLKCKNNEDNSKVLMFCFIEIQYEDMGEMDAEDYLVIKGKSINTKFKFIRKMISHYTWLYGAKTVLKKLKNREITRYIIF